MKTSTGIEERRRRLAGIEVDPEVVRRARIESGLSMADLAGSDFSRHLVYLIETGRCRPSEATLRVIAERTGQPFQSFIKNAETHEEPEDPRTSALQGLYARERFREVVEVGSAILESGDLSVRQRALVNFCVGAAQTRSSQPREGAEKLEAARAEFVNSGEILLAAECLDWEGLARHYTQDQRAIELLQQALSLCTRQVSGVGAVRARILTHIAAVHIDLEEWDEAIASCQAALEAAGPLRELALMARLYKDMSVALEESGRRGLALRYARKALAISQGRDDPDLAARVHNNLGLLLVRRGRFAEAMRHLELAAEACARAGTQAGRAHVLLSLAECATGSGDLDAANRWLQEALVTGKRLHEPLTLARAQELIGDICLIRNEWMEAVQYFEASLAELGRAGAKRRLVHLHRKVADAFEARDNPAAANRHLHEALDLAETKPKRARVRRSSTTPSLRSASEI